MTTSLWPLTTVGQAKAAMLHLQTVFQEHDNDIRTLGHSKTLHRFAEAVGLDNWHRFVSENNRALFERTLQQEFGLSAQYTDASALAINLEDDHIDPVEVARQYAQRYNITPSKPVYGQDKDMTEQAHAHLADLLSDDNDVAIYGAGCLIETTLVIASGVTLSLSVDPNSRRVTKGMVRCTGFGTLGVAHIAPEELGRIAERYADDIDNAISDILSN